MKFDAFFSLCQNEINGQLPSEQLVFSNFFDQVKLADELGFETAWIAEAHLSSEVQKQNHNAVIPHFKGEIGLNTDILQMAHKVFSITKKINVGSAIRNILCNGGPVAHAEAVKTFLALHEWSDFQSNGRKLNLGFASGRFEFANQPYGIIPRSRTEKVAWSALKGKILKEAVEIFLRLLKSEVISSADIEPKVLEASSFRSTEDWEKVKEVYSQETGLDKEEIKSIEIPSFWNFDKLGVIPQQVSLDLLKLTLGSHDPSLQIFANQFLPVEIFNLSIVPSKVIEETHERMSECYQGDWSRDKMPRTVMIFLDNTHGLSDKEKSKKAEQAALKAWENYWTAMKGTLDKEKVQKAVENSLWGHSRELVAKIKEKYHPDDRLMCWFDFNNHDGESVKAEMREFMKSVAPELS